MRPSILFLAAFFTLGMTAPAFALSIDRDTGMNSDGSAKFADPDEQMPNFMTPSSSTPSTPQTTPGVTMPMTSDGGGPSLSFSGGNLGPQQQPDAFDHAYAHFGN